MASSRRLSISDARKDFAEVVNKVAYGPTQVVIGLRDRELTAAVPISDLRMLLRDVRTGPGAVAGARTSRPRG